MLKDTFYRISAHEGDTYIFSFNSEHPIFKAHFPGKPIVPGACLVQMAQEILCTQRHQEVRFRMISNLKFQHPLTPNIPSIRVQITSKEENQVKVTYSVGNEGYAFFTGTYE